MARKPTKKATAEKPKDEKPSTYEDIAKRVVAATHELNSAMKEAFGMEECRVEFRRVGDDLPAQFECRVYRMTHGVHIFIATPKLERRVAEWTAEARAALNEEGEGR